MSSMKLLLCAAVFALVLVPAGCGGGGDDGGSSDALTGTWQVIIDGALVETVTLTQQGDTLYFSDGPNGPFSVQIVNNTFTFVEVDPGETQTYVGTIVNNDLIQGTYTSSLGGSGTWLMTRSTGSPPPYQPYELFPVTLGSSWTYDNGRTVTVTSASESGGSLYATIGNEGGGGQVNLVLSGTEVTFSDYTNPDYIMVAYTFSYKPLLKIPMSLGTSWSGDLTSNGYTIYFDCTVISTTTPVTIGATTYDNCTVLDVNYSFPGGYDSSTYVVNRELSFYPGVGCVRRTDTRNDSGVSTIEIVSYDIR